jgi:hypothetical protein
VVHCYGVGGSGGAGAGEVSGGVDQPNVAEGLRSVAQLAAGGGVVFLCEDPEAVAQGQQSLEQPSGLVGLSDAVQEHQVNRTRHFLTRAGTTTAWRRRFQGSGPEGCRVLEAPGHSVGDRRPSGGGSTASVGPGTARQDRGVRGAWPVGPLRS